jgi:tetratricopeptide (TPR) repeat protein
VRHAEHLDRADHPAAAEAYRRAAEACAADFRFERAMGLVERGQALAATPPERFALACLRAEILDSLGEVPKAVDAFAEARALATDDAALARACLGLAAGKRVTEDLDGAVAALAEAEAAAVRAGLGAERARIHHMRGNLCFPRGDLEGCLREHRAALDWARQAGAGDLEVAALGGLGDAHYAHGRMVTAHEHFARCVALARERGLPRVEAANLCMAGITRLYLNDLHGALEDARAGARAAQAIGHRRAELLSHVCVYEVLYELGDAVAGRDHLARARALTQLLGALRFETEHLTYEARLERLAGNAGSACALLTRALDLARETGLGYMGPSILAELALCRDDPAARRAALDEGEGLLPGGSVGHNHLQFYRDAIDTALDLTDWELAERYAQALEDYAAAERLPWCTLFAARGRALAAWGRGRRDGETRQALLRALEDCRRAGYAPPLARLEAALGGG